MSKTIDIASEDQYRDTLRNSGNKLVVVDFYATWCGPCQQCAPQYAALSTKYTNVVFLKVDVDKHRGIASNAGVKAMPTFMLYRNNTKVTEITGADMNKLEQLILQYGDNFEAFKGQGKTLGTPGKPFVNPWKSDQPPVKKNKPEEESTPNEQAPEPVQPTPPKQDLMQFDDEDDDVKKAIALSLEQESKQDIPADTKPSDEEMKTEEENKEKPAVDQEEVMKLIEAQVDQAVLKELLDMEFPKIRALKSLINTGNKGQEAAIEWLLNHQEDADIDDPIEYKIETDEEKAKRLAEAKEKAKQLQAEARRKVQEIEKKAEIDREKKRRESGKEINEVKEKFEAAQRIRERELEAAQKKKDKEDKAKIKRQLKEDQARRKAERLIKEGKLDEVRELENEMKMSFLPKDAKTSTGVTSSSSSSATSSSTNTTSQTKSEPTEATVRIRLLDGTTQNCTFKPTDTLRTVYNQAALLMGGNKRFSLMVPPRTTFATNQLDSTNLKTAGLAPRGQVVCTPNV
ncbi:thioredoxin [Acrasis kona]|uniref:Thioredoxin n=1 Tax=Acrasis kona TaxID=1008807 RepID=A0AAW2ZBP7_9EUKA